MPQPDSSLERRPLTELCRSACRFPFFCSSAGLFFLHFRVRLCWPRLSLCRPLARCLLGKPSGTEAVRVQLVHSRASAFCLPWVCRFGAVWHFLTTTAL